MYESFYGLKYKPFELTPDGNNLYLSDTHKEAVATLRYGVIADKGFLMLTGGVGTGKTTVLNALLPMLKKKVRLCVLNNPKLTAREFLYYVAKKLDLVYRGNKSDFILQFQRLLDDCADNNEKVLIIIDEAQVFSVDLMEEVRLLSNHAEDRNVLSIFLIGQPELQKTLAHPRLLPLRQRIGLRYHLPELTRNDTTHYIAYRLNRAGAGRASIFTPDALDCIHQASRGNPRLINVVCDHALIAGFVKEARTIDARIVVECLRDIRLPSEKGLRLAKVDKVLPTPEKPRAAEKRRKKSEPLRNLLFALFLVVLVCGVFYVAYVFNLVTFG